jgi:hypothetical protein
MMSRDEDTMDHRQQYKAAQALSVEGAICPAEKVKEV